MYKLFCVISFVRVQIVRVLQGFLNPKKCLYTYSMKWLKKTPADTHMATMLAKAEKAFAVLFIILLVAARTSASRTLTKRIRWSILWWFFLNFTNWYIYANWFIYLLSCDRDISKKYHCNLMLTVYKLIKLIVVPFWIWTTWLDTKSSRN